MVLPADDHVLRLRAAVQALRAPETAKRAPAPTSSVYGRAAAAVPADTRTSATREQLDSRFRDVQTTLAMPGSSLVLVVLPDRGDPTPVFAQKMQRLVSAGGQVIVLGEDVTRSVDRSQPITVPLRSGDSLSSEWGLIVCGPTGRVAFLARRQDDDRWSWLLTRDAIAVHRAATAILERLSFLQVRVPPLDVPAGVRGTTEGIVPLQQRWGAAPR